MGVFPVCKLSVLTEPSFPISEEPAGIKYSLPCPLEMLVRAGEVRVTHFYCPWNTDLDLGGGLKVTGFLGEFILWCLAGLSNGIYLVW